MVEKYLALTHIKSILLLKSIPVLIDGEKAVRVSDENYAAWAQELKLATPVFEQEIPSHMLEAWKFAFNLGESISLKQMYMTKPTTTTRRPDGSWGSYTTPCSIACKKCDATYPVFGKFSIGDKEYCNACGYMYVFMDW